MKGIVEADESKTETIEGSEKQSGRKMNGIAEVD